jgi:hypothetical protein
MRSVLALVCAGLVMVAGLAMMLLFLYVEWWYLSSSFWQMFNPFLHLQVMVTLLTLPVFWGIAAVGGLGWGVVHLLTPRSTHGN